MIIAITTKRHPDAVDQLSQLVDGRGVLENVVERRDGSKVVSFRGSEALIEVLSSSSCVERVLQMSGHWGLVGRESNPASAPVAVGRVQFGGPSIPVIAGPCSVENVEQLRAVAEGVKAAGAVCLRGGAFKPRTSPYAFQGLGAEGLNHLDTIRRECGLPVVTEVMSPEDVDCVAASADMLQIGSRNVQNFRLLEAVGRSDKPVLLKRGMMSTIDEFLGAAEYIFVRGNENIVLCERGIRGFEPRMRNTLDLASVALLKRLTHLPVIVDPSHGTGLSELVPALARAALAVGADGIMTEVHPRPEAARSDGRQSLSIVEFAQLMKELAPLARVMGRPLASSAEAALEA